MEAGQIVIAPEVSERIARSRRVVDADGRRFYPWEWRAAQAVASWLDIYWNLFREWDSHAIVILEHPAQYSQQVRIATLTQYLADLRRVVALFRLSADYYDAFGLPTHFGEHRDGTPFELRGLYDGRTGAVIERYDTTAKWREKATELEAIASEIQAELDIPDGTPVRNAVPEGYDASLPAPEAGGMSGVPIVALMAASPWASKVIVLTLGVVALMVAYQAVRITVAALTAWLGLDLDATRARGRAMDAFTRCVREATTDQELALCRQRYDTALQTLPRGRAWWAGGVGIAAAGLGAFYLVTQIRSNA